MRIVRVPSLLLAVTLLLGPAATTRSRPAAGARRKRFVVSAANGGRRAEGAARTAGFEIQLVASEPEINKPLNLAFDDRGRLWVTSTVEYPYPAKEGTRPRDSVKILSNFSAGRASAEGGNICRWLEYSHRSVADAVGAGGHCAQHPEHLHAEGHRRRRTG